jgi:hypothetical protein
MRPFKIALALQFLEIAPDGRGGRPDACGQFEDRCRSFKPDMFQHQGTPLGGNQFNAMDFSHD